MAQKQKQLLAIAALVCAVVCSRKTFSSTCQKCSCNHFAAFCLVMARTSLLVADNVTVYISQDKKLLIILNTVHFIRKSRREIDRLKMAILTTLYQTNEMTGAATTPAKLS